MATIGNTNLTLLDHAKRTDPSGRIAQIVELLTQQNEILLDATFKEGNLPTGHRIVQRTGLPDVYWRSLNQGVPSSKATTTQVDEAIGMLEGYSEVDKDLAMLNGDKAAFRFSEDTAFMEAMNQTAADAMFYGNPQVNPAQPAGFAVRTAAIAGAGNSQNVLSAGGSGSDNMSVYLVGWGDNSVYGIYPKGSAAGLQMNDLGEDTLIESTGAKYQVLRSHFQWKFGLAVKDWRYLVRIANIDVSDLVGQTATQALTAQTHVHRIMARAIDRLPTRSNCKPVFYANRTLLSHFRVHALDRSNNVFSVENSINQFGQNIETVRYMGIPVRMVDRLGLAETVVA